MSSAKPTLHVEMYRSASAGLGKSARAGFSRMRASLWLVVFLLLSSAAHAADAVQAGLRVAWRVGSAAGPALALVMTGSWRGSHPAQVGNQRMRWNTT